MAYIFATVSTIVTGALLALLTFTLGVKHHGVLFAVSVIGAGFQAMIPIGWYLYDEKKREARRRAAAADYTERAS